MKKIPILFKIKLMDTLEKVSAFHGHVCPGLAIGVRVSEYALRELGARADDEELVAVVENDSCAVDAVQAITGCTFGKGNLIFRDYGKQVYTFIKRPGGEALRISVQWISPRESDEDKKMWKRYMDGDSSHEVLEAVHTRRSKKIKAISDASDGELFKVTKMTVEPPPKARIYPSVRCAMCGEKTMEPRARVLDEKIVCLPCFNRRSGISDHPGGPGGPGEPGISEAPGGPGDKGER